ncbi:MAG: putative toxin-antitoxin system toxin component, PIN family [Burkholderiales bacterium]
MRIVLDSNVIISGALAPEGVPGKIVAAWREARFDLVTSLAQLEEIGRVLAYPKIRSRLKWDDERIGQFLRQLYLRAEIVELSGAQTELPRDAGDAHILACLVEAKADLLVTGDNDLLALRKRHPIETPAEFVKRL